MILPYKPTSSFAKDLFVQYLDSLQIPVKDIVFHPARNEFSIEIHDLDYHAVETLFTVIDHRYSILNRMRSFRDYKIIQEYPEKSEQFFQSVTETKLVSKTYSLQLSTNGVYYLTNSACNHISRRDQRIINTVLWISRQYRPIAISNFGNFSILRDRRGFHLINNLNEHIVHLDRLDPMKTYIFIFNTMDKNFGVVDPNGEFTYLSITGQPLVKLRLNIDSYLDVKQVIESRLIITDSAIYNFTGETVLSASGQFVFHGYQQNRLIRENLFTQKLELVDADRITHQFDIYNDRLINRAVLIGRLLVINYEDDLLQFIDTQSRRTFSVFTSERIRSIGYQHSTLYVLLVNNILQIIDLNDTPSADSM